MAKELGIDEVHAELLPADKVAQVERLLREKPKKEKLAFVGDGINDAPVLTRADIGIAMGSMGSDAAIEAADVVLMDDDVRKIASIVRISRKTLSHRKTEHRFCTRRKSNRIAARSFWRGQYVGSCFRRCRSFCHCDPELHACTEREVRKGRQKRTV